MSPVFVKPGGWFSGESAPTIPHCDASLGVVTLPVFDYDFVVEAPVAAVAAFHGDTSALKRLTPPPTILQLHEIEPLAEGSVSRFTIWVGPLPIKWTAVHRDVTPFGFTDVQAEGPAKKWEHTHRFEAIDSRSTRVKDHIEYEHASGFWGAVTRVLFSQPNLTVMFAYRKFIIRRSLRNQSPNPA